MNLLMNLFLFVFVISTAVIIAEDVSDTRIVGGVNARPNEFPYQVSLQKNGQHFCGGSIIHQSWIVTAGHCKIDGDIIVVAGQHDFRRETGDEQRRKIIKFIVHEMYKGDVGPDDIALIMIDRPFVFNSKVKSIKLPTLNAYPRGNAVVSGWGSISRIPSMPINPDILQKATLPIHPQSSCHLYLFGTPFTDRNVCAGPLSGSRAICNGDSGGPLAHGPANDRVLVGIVSWGALPCGRVAAPGVFVQISKYLDWIADNYEKSLVNA